MVFIVCAFIAYLPRMFDPTSTKKGGKYLSVLNRRELHTGFHPKETLPHFSILLSEKHGRSREACVCYPDGEEEGSSGDRSWHPSTEPLLQGPETEGASSRSSSPAGGGKGQEGSAAHTQRSQPRVMLTQHLVNLGLAKPAAAEAPETVVTYS